MSTAAGKGQLAFERLDGPAPRLAYACANSIDYVVPYLLISGGNPSIRATRLFATSIVSITCHYERHSGVGAGFIEEILKQESTVALGAAPNDQDQA